MSNIYISCRQSVKIDGIFLNGVCPTNNQLPYKLLLENRKAEQEMANPLRLLLKALVACDHSDTYIRARMRHACVRFVGNRSRTVI